MAVGIFADGGYSPTARVAFGLSALLAASVAIAASGQVDGLREPVVLALFALALVGAVSALWTAGLADRALIWALVTAAYGAVAAAAFAVGRRAGGVVGLSAAIAVLAFAAAAIGLAAGALEHAPYALRLGGRWRPAGPFEYPPALALLQVSALPALIVAAARGSDPVARAAACGLALAGGVLALSASRTGLALGILVAGLALAAPRHTTARPRAVVAGAIGLCAACGLAMALVLHAQPAPEARLGTVVGVALAAALAWPRLRPLLPGDGGRPSTRRFATGLLAGACVLAVVGGSLAFGWAGGQGGFLHGRDETWRAAAATLADHPVAGAGADAFLAASVRHQDGQSIRFAHNLPLELGAELGLVGLMGALGLYGLTARALWQARRTPGAWLLGPAAAGFLIAGLVDWPWHLAGSGAVWALALGGLASCVDSRSAGPHPADPGPHR